MQPTYLFYDIETSGLNKCFDQVLQFAAIRTDLKLNELECYQFLIKPNPDTIIAPEALLTHQIPWETLLNGEKELGAMEKIHELLNTPNTISVGYNSLEFDDEFLRFSFYRNLLPPYTHQYANNCGRMDIYLMVIMYYLFKPQIMDWPKINDKLTLKLEDLNNLNHFAPGTAHDALVDVKITLNLARRLFQEPEMWQYLCGYFNKNTDLTRSKKLEVIFNDHRQALIVDRSIGSANNYLGPVLNLGQHLHYKNQDLWLRLDLPQLATTTETSIATTTNVFRKKFGEGGFLMPQDPRYLIHVSSERLNLAQQNLQWLQKNSALLEAIKDYHLNYTYPKIPNLDVDAALYQLGFPSEQDKYLCTKFHLSNTSEKIGMLDQFKNSNLRTQAIRVLGRNYFEALPATLAQEYHHYLKHIYFNDEAPIDYRGKKHLTCNDALTEIKALRQTIAPNPNQLQLLAQLERHLIFLATPKK